MPTNKDQEANELTRRIEQDSDPVDHNRITNPADGFDAADQAQRDGVATAVADHLMKDGYVDAADYVRSLASNEPSDEDLFAMLADIFGDDEEDDE